MPITYSMTIDSPIERAFACVDDIEKVKQWAGIESITPLDPWDPANPIGSRSKQVIREGGRLTEYEGEVVAYDRPHHLAITLRGSAFTMRVDYRFTALDARSTRLDYEAVLLYGSTSARLIYRLFSWLTRRIVRRQMAALKQLAESDAWT